MSNIKRLHYLPVHRLDVRVSLSLTGGKMDTLRNCRMHTSSKIFLEQTLIPPPTTTILLPQRKLTSIINSTQQQYHDIHNWVPFCFLHSVTSKQTWSNIFITSQQNCIQKIRRQCQFFQINHTHIFKMTDKKICFIHIKTALKLKYYHTLD